ncbi:peptidoglycan-binding domain-containing protein [Eleftheria terrae]|uniref:peptidoglycan-binding domain-containing protein n=1 Tax=Eleftheria terrae TaxID=1597781 RepID=UPI00263B7A99|nr:peptidoglycan-binding protein [Eleftheria terrae]WKB55799.1 peptidoglycan-binding protein [Eleftheria terrae]
MSTVTISEGDSVVRIAGATGFAPETLWSHPANAELRKRREHMDVLNPGDVLTVPERTPKTVAAATDRRHRFRRRGVPMHFTLQLLDAWGEPRRQRPYRLVVDGRLLEGTTDADGVLRHHLPTTAQRGTLQLDEVELALVFGGLDPKSTLAGVQHRLSNLGFPCAGDAGELGQATRLALARFQRLMELPCTGELDERTRDALDAHHQQLNQLAQHIATQGLAP